MADCGATGSAVDRAARVFGGDGLANLLTTAAAGGTTTGAIPEAPPKFLPQLQSHQQQPAMSQAATAIQTAPAQELQPSMASHFLQPQHAVATTSFPQQTTNFPQQLQSTLPFLSPQHMVMQMQQQQAMMGAMLQQQLQQRQQQQQQQGNIGVEGTARPATIQDLSQAWEEATSEGAKPATIEELSSAWLEANEDWQAVADELSDFYGLDDLGNPELYEFHNKASGQQMDDWMQQGMKSFQSGDIADAVYAFEMELQIKSSDNAKAWRMLGHCHAEQDMDRDAILCLEHAVEVDPYDISARLALGVSYVNELEHSKALEHLKAWVTHNPQLSDVSGIDIYGDGTFESPFDEVQHLLLSALNSTKDSQSLADIHTALGVVYNVSRDYDAAIDAFQRATNFAPENYQLWNKLGATLANHNQSEEALRMYRRALELKPKYARAWLNTAISHANLQQYDSAASCYLQTLSLNPSATHCWSYLRVAISCAERNDLLPLVAERNLNELRLRFGLTDASLGMT